MSKGPISLEGVAIGDFNGDDKVDFAAGANPNFTPGGSFVFLGNGDGTCSYIIGVIYVQTPASLLPTYVNFYDVPVNTKSAPAMWP